MSDDRIFDGKTYQLVEILDHEGNSKAAEGHPERVKYQYWAGCYTDNIWLRPFPSVNSPEECLKAIFVVDAEGMAVNKNLRTSPIRNMEASEGRVTVRTYNSVYVFEEKLLPKAVYREEADLLELWMGSGPYKFDKGVHYDKNGTPHDLTVMVHLGMLRDSFLICHRDNVYNIAARYFMGFQSIEWYDTLTGSQDYSTPMRIHNTSDHPLLIKGGPIEFSIPPGKELTLPLSHRRREG